MLLWGSPSLHLTVSATKCTLAPVALPWPSPCKIPAPLTHLHPPDSSPWFLHPDPSLIPSHGHPIAGPHVSQQRDTPSTVLRPRSWSPMPAASSAPVLPCYWPLLRAPVSVA